MLQRMTAEDLLEVVPLRLPRAGERIVAERRRRMTFRGHFWDWMLETLLVRPRAADEEGVHDTLVGLRDESTRVWVLQTLVAHRIDPATVQVRIGLTDECDVDPDEWQRLEIAPGSAEEPDPVLAALDDVDDLQQQLQRDEARRVVAAVRAWRVALAEEGEPTAANTPYQRGFFADLALRLRVASTTARAMVHTAADLEAALPRTWGLFVHGGTSWRVMQTVHAELEGLDPALHDAFDEGVLRRIVEIAPTGLADALRRLRERLQAATADDRHERAAARRHVVVEPAADGMAWLHAYLPAADALSLDHQLSGAAVAAAGRQDETRGIGQLRADVLVDGLRQALRRPKRAVKSLVRRRRPVQPQVLVTIPALAALGHADAPATLEGYGVIGTRTALRLAGEAKSWVRVLTDPFSGAPLQLARTRYRPSKDLRLLIRMLDGQTRGPSAPRPPGRADIDHVIPYRQDGSAGTTDPDNLALLTRRDHLDKTDHALGYRLLADRTALWNTPNGTIVITRPAEPQIPTPVPPHLIDPEDCPF